jgi:3-phenylpropionate/trans-cinnamate dioxygenase ferredoxin subunit
MTSNSQRNLGSLSDLQEGEKRSLSAGDTQVLVCRVNGALFAVEDLCSHANTALCGGRLSGYLITCPLHSAQFDVRTGKHQGPPAHRGIRSFPVTETPHGAVVEITPGASPPPSFGAPVLTR